MEFSDIDILIFQNLQFWYCSLGLSTTGQIRWQETGHKKSK